MASADTPDNDFVQMADDARRQVLLDSSDDPVMLVEQVYQLWWHWADFEMYIINPSIETITPPLIIQPEVLAGTDEKEFVYPIFDYGNKLATSKALEMYTAGMSMCRLYYTIEKMIFLLLERMKSGGIDEQTEVQIAFGGHELAQRKAFESIINLSYNVVVSNFDPGVWGERYLQNVKRIADKGYGYPPESPRSNYKQSHGGTSRTRMSR